MSIYEGPIVDVVYDNVDGWHRFTSPELPKLHVLTGPEEYYLGLETVRQAIENLVNSQARSIAVRPLTRLPTCECLGTKTTNEVRPRVLRYWIESSHYSEIANQEHLRDQVRRLETLHEKAPDPDTRAVLQKMIADVKVQLSGTEGDPSTGPSKTDKDQRPE